MPIDPTKPLSWKSEDGEVLALLQTLQGNILKGHGRHHTANLLFTLKVGNERASRGMLRDLANFHVTSAYRQLRDAESYKRAGKKRKGGKGAGPFVHIALTAPGYDAIGRTDAKPDDTEFLRGMDDAGSIADLADPAITAWEPKFQTKIHGLVIAAHETESEVGDLAKTLVALIEGAGATVFIQHGNALFNAAKEGIEHFGYVDGRSQPLMLKEDVDEERAATGTDRWDPAFGPGIALVEDPGSPLLEDGHRSAFGSYLIFRKLEQKVRAFKTREQEVATILGLKGDDRERAGAMIVGRFEDGTPVTLSKTARGLKPPNNFDYEGDPGIRCPIHAHIRKVNPRGSGLPKAGEDEQRTHLMPRRGIPYQDKHREVQPSELPDAGTMADFKKDVAPKLPLDGVGLLFMAYNANIGNQFKVTQQFWANATGFPPPGPHGIDPVIGQGPLVKDEQKLPKEWDGDTPGNIVDKVDFAGFVHMKGGAYLFSPSLSFLLTL